MSSECWYIYGVAERSSPADKVSVTSGNMASLQEAETYVIKCMLQYGRVVAAIIHLERGQDINGERHVVRRINNGRAWWE